MRSGMTLRLGLAIAGVMLAGVAAGAQGPGGGPGMSGGFGGHRPPFERAFGARGDQGRWWNNPKMVEELKLTDAQRKSMDDILLSHREKLIDLKASLEKAELSLEPLMKEDQPNEAGILAGIDRVAQARAELEKANARFLLAIRGKLTPDQWKQLQADREHHGQQGRGGFGRDGQGRGGQGHGGPGGPGRGAWGQGGQGPGGQGPGAQFRHRQGPPPSGTPAPGATPAPSSAPAAPGPQTMDGAGADATGASQGGGQQ
jgi:Spy/CpxP family protein refolding chaperone